MQTMYVILSLIVVGVLIFVFMRQRKMKVEGIGEPDFEAILGLNLESEETALYVQSSLEKFNGAAVFPLLKAYENGKERTGAFILMLPDSESVYQRVIDAMNHGRFFPQNVGKTISTAADLMKAADSWWGPLLLRKYGGNRQFAQYCAAHVPQVPDAQFIMLFIAADPEMAFESLFRGPLQGKPMSSLATLGDALFQREARGLPDETRAQYFDRLFAATRPDMIIRPAKDGEPEESLQCDLMFKVQYLPLGYQERFYIEYFRHFRTEDRNLSLFRILRLPQPARGNVIRAIMPWCSEEERALITVDG